MRVTSGSAAPYRRSPVAIGMATVAEGYEIFEFVTSALGTGRQMVDVGLSRPIVLVVRDLAPTVLATVVIPLKSTFTCVRPGRHD